LKKKIQTFLKFIIIVLSIYNTIVTKSYSEWNISYASIDSTIYLSKKLQNNSSNYHIIHFRTLVEYFKPIKKNFYSTIYNMKVDCLDNKTAFIEKTFYSERLISSKEKYKNNVKKLKFLDNKKKFFWYNFEKNAWWTLLSEEVCEKKFSAHQSNLNHKVYKNRLKNLKKWISKESLEKTKSHFGEQLFDEILMFREKNWNIFKKRLIRDISSNKL
jgi:hypothetical protein